MPRDGSKTRLRILEESTKLVFENGFSGTTIDQILERSKITKGAFFYHFKNKADLAKNLIEHFRESDMQMLREARSIADQSGSNPKDQFLAFIQWHINYFDKLKEPHSGCLYASFVYEPEQFDEEIESIVASAILEWRKEISEMLERAVTSTKSGSDIDLESLADMFSVILEGAFITSKALNDPKLTSKQLKHYRRYIELLI